jgi:hypothetical protein
MMKKTISQYEFIQMFDDYNRSDNFSREGRAALYNYLTDWEAVSGKEIELDVIAICCEYSEYSDLAEFQANYSDEYETIEDIEEQTTVIRIDDESFIVQDF